MLDLAAAGEVVCSSAVVDLAEGSELRVDERAAAGLEVVPGRLRVYVAVG